MDWIGEGGREREGVFIYLKPLVNIISPFKEKSVPSPDS